RSDVPEHLLFYAGCDKKHEQIGLAVSQDGIRFERAGDDGLIVPVDPAVRWRDLRTCNPAVVRPDGTAGRFVMFFQGISTEQENVSIARAVSADGRTWTVDPEPCISWRELVAPGDGGPGSTRKAVFEPSVLHEDGRYRMWFCHLNAPVHASVSLFYAESRDGERWELERRPLLSGDTFGFCALHYPQVRRLDPGYELLFTLRSRRPLVERGRAGAAAAAADGPVAAKRRGEGVAPRRAALLARGRAADPRLLAPPRGRGRAGRDVHPQQPPRASRTLVRRRPGRAPRRPLGPAGNGLRAGGRSRRLGQPLRRRPL